MKNLITKEEKDRIDEICNDHRIENYTINSDGSIDVDGDVNLHEQKLKELPIKFNTVSGNFICNDNQLTSLVGCPTTVGGFDCVKNQLTSLVGCPTTVSGYFDCGHNYLTSLVGGPVEVGGHFNCDDNRLTSLVDGPTTIGKGYSCFFNMLTTLHGSPTTVKGNFYCSHNQLTSLVGGPEWVGGDLLCGHNKLTSLEGAPTATCGYFDCKKNLLTSTYSGDIDIELRADVCFTNSTLPQLFNENIEHIVLILKYQRHFMIWNEDLSLNEENFNDLIAEINEGLE